MIPPQLFVRSRSRSVASLRRPRGVGGVAICLAASVLLTTFTARAVETFAKVVSGLPGDGWRDAVSLQQAEADADGNLFVAGSVRGPARFAPGIELTRKTTGSFDQEPYDLFLGILDPKGGWVSARRILVPLPAVVGFDGPTVTTPRREVTVLDVALGATNIYVAGQFPSNGSPGVGFVVKLDRSGNVIWTRYIISSNATVSSVVEGADGSVYFAGSFSGLFSAFILSDGAVRRTDLGSTDSSTGDVAAYIIKVDSNSGILWSQYTASLSGHREEVVAMEGDGNGDLHVLMNLRGNSIDIRNAGGTVFQSKVKLDYSVAPWVGKLGANGVWKTGRALGAGDLASLPKNAVGLASDVVGTDLKLVGGKVFVSGSGASVQSGVTFRRGFVTRLSAVDYLADGAVALFWSGDSDKSQLNHPVRLRGAGRTLFVAGYMPPTLEVYGQIPSGASDPGPVDMELTSLQPSRFVGALDTDLKPLWLRTTSRADTVTRPFMDWNLLAYDASVNRVYWGGLFRAQGTSKLLLGEPPAEAALTTDAGTDGVDGWGWLTAFDTQGRSIRQVRLTVDSEFPPIVVNGMSITATNYSDTLLEGATVQVAVVDQEANGTRHLVDGYTIDNLPGSTPARNLTTTLVADTRVTFKWKTQHRLHIESNHASAGLINDASAGNPEPLYGDTWIEHGANVDATVAGYVTPVDASSWGTRYVVASYVFSNPIPKTNQVTQIVDRLRVEALKSWAMTNPATVLFQWKKQHRINVQVSNPDAGTLPLTRRTSGGTSTQSQPGTGELWFDQGGNLEVMARGTNVAKTLLLKGWDFASPVPGSFPKSTFQVSPTNSDVRADLLQNGRLTSVIVSNDVYYEHILTNFSGPAAISWNYGDPIQTTNIAVGVAFAFPSVNGKTASTAGWSQVRVLDGPPGSIGTDMVIWDPKNQRIIPTRPGIFQVDVPYRDATSSNTVVWQVYSDFAGQPWRSDPAGPNRYINSAGAQRHVAGTPAVPLDPSDSDRFFFKEFRYSSADGFVADRQFSAASPGRSVLVFSSLAATNTGPALGDLTREDLTVRVIETVKWDAAGILKTNAAAVPIGSPLASADDLAQLGTGYVVHEIANYNADIYDRQRVSGPIVPVNNRVTRPDLASGRELVVVWYQADFGVRWPYQPVFYPNFAWPSPTLGNRIVIASRLGSEGLDGTGVRQLVFDPETYEDVRVYQQPDRERPGYNPNEEHARIYPSLHGLLSGQSVPSAFALRDDLNVTTNVITASAGALKTNQYTSDPYVLVQYRNKTTGNYGMQAYAVLRQDPATVDPWVAELPGSTGNSYRFTYRMTAGERITAPYPLNLVLGLSPCINTISNLFSTAAAVPNGTYYADAAGQSRAWFVDHKHDSWAVAGDSIIRAYFSYPLAPDLWYPFDLDAPALLADGPGDCVPWLPVLDVAGKKLGVFDRDAADFRVRTEPIEVTYATVWPENPPVLKVGETLTYAGGEYKADHPDAPGLPGILGFAAAEVVFDSKNPGLRTSIADAVNWRSSFSARIIAPLEERLVALARTNLPTNLSDPSQPDVTVAGDTWYFNTLPPSLQKRIFYRPLARLAGSPTLGVLGLRGFVNDRTLGAGDLTAAPPPVYVLEPNVLSSFDRDDLFRIATPGSDPWVKAVDALVALSRNPAGLSVGGWNVGLERVAGTTTDVKPLQALGPGLALVTNPRLLDPSFATSGSNYVTIAENNHPSLGDAPITLHVIRVDPGERYRGAIKTMLPANVFDEKISLRHTADFGGNVDQVAYAWWYHEEDGTVKTGDVPPGGVGGTPVWQAFNGAANGQLGRVEIPLNGNPTLLLADQLFFTHYRYDQPALAGGDWSDWAGAANSSVRDLDANGLPDYRGQLATGWIKRVLDAVNPFEARVREFGRGDSPATASSLIRQLGAPYVGPVALNASKDVIENLGLIELYETVLKRAADMTVNGSAGVTSPGINSAILLASTRLAEFYTLLANEAWDDALDPTIGYGSAALDRGNLNASRFCFENQMPSLLEEELALLRGGDESHGRPVFNRLFWNFTKGEGEVAYALNYQIADVNQDGFVDENDALKQYPQGHGDAWGHYLSAMRKRYDLLRNSLFDWENRGEYYNLLDVVIGVDFEDERAFARTAVARARVGAEIVQLTFRSRYSEAPDSKLSGYTDSDRDRAWGVTEWSRRAGQAALFDWVTANALLPFADPRADVPPSRKLDRTTVEEIGQIPTQITAIQIALDGANSGLNAIGLDPDILPFDLDPTHIDVGSTAQIGRTAVQGLSHFEQIFERAYEALRNASAAFDYANQQKLQIRQVEDTAEDLRRQAVAQDLEFRNRLIEIFGTPYQGQIGAGKAYPAGYAGPDLNLFMYVDVNAITSNTVPVANADAYFDEYVSFYSLTNDIPEEFRGDLTEHFLNDISLEGNTAVELLGDDLVHLKLPATAGDYTFTAPAEWGQRAAPGRLQTVVGDMLQVQADLTLAVGDYDYLIKQLRDRVELIRLRAEIDTDILGVKEARYNTIVPLTTLIDGLRAGAAASEFAATIVNDIIESTVDGLPKTVDDFFFGVRVTLRTGMAVNQLVQRASALVANQTADVLESSKEIMDLRDEIAIDQKEMSVELRGMLHEIEEMLVNEGVLRVRLFALREQLRGLLDQYRGTLQEGLRIVEERRNAHAQLAAATQNNRYHDLLFRTGRHESIQRFRVLYDLAQRYCYMAAKAYDYETNFDPQDRASARPLLNDIVRARSLGALGDNFPLAGGGLAGIMARLQDNFRAVEGRLGFNNLQLDTTSFSLRREMLRLVTDSAWTNALAAARVADLWQIQEFRRWCRPFAPRGDPEPGIVLPIATEIVAGKNFFGQYLGPGDSAYDPSLYATKIRSAGIRFHGYPVDRLARTPYVYLVPAGMDTMTIPNSRSLAQRTWKVMDQAIPVPHVTGPLDLMRETWLPGLDSLSGTLGEARRFSSFRAAVTDEDPTLNVTRFVGRSVWNDRWVLIIPGQTLSFGAKLGLDEFVNSVTDIVLTFETYGYSGN